MEGRNFCMYRVHRSLCNDSTVIQCMQGAWYREINKTPMSIKRCTNFGANVESSKKHFLDEMVLVPTGIGSVRAGLG